MVKVITLLSKLKAVQSFWLSWKLLSKHTMESSQIILYFDLIIKKTMLFLTKSDYCLFEILKIIVKLN